MGSNRFNTLVLGFFLCILGGGLTVCGATGWNGIYGKELENPEKTLYFGIGILVFAAIIFISLLATKEWKPR